MINKIKYPDKSFYCESTDYCYSGDPLVYRINSYEDIWFLKQIIDTHKQVH